jgi:hypothetical protein
VVHDKKKGDLDLICSDCYGAERQFHYVIVDKMGKPIKGSYSLSEHVEEVADSQPSEQATARPDIPKTTPYFMDTIGVGSSGQIGYFYSKSVQTFSVKYKGNEYYLSTKIEQIISKTSAGLWMIQANVLVP